MKQIITSIILSFFTISVFAQIDTIFIEEKDGDMRLMINGAPFMINGMNWDYYPIGTNYEFSIWKQPDEIIQAALDEEMMLLKEMGINAIRQYTGVPAKWITYIYENYGIYTMLNHSFGRYGLTIDGEWVANTAYGRPKVRTILLEEVKELAREYKDTPGLLFYLLGNENNYGLFWEGAETENIPVEKKKSTIRARAMYQLFNEAAVLMKGIDQKHPIVLCNGDLLFLDLIKEWCKDFDVFGTNMYRGVSFGDAFERVKTTLNKPILFTEFGSDVFNAIDSVEDQRSQAYFMVGNWKEIYKNAAGLGNAGNAIGGFTFQFSDGWWKFGQTYNLKVHDLNASWSNGGYGFDYIDEKNNMNEEWFGICAKGPTNEKGLYQSIPRAAYYALKEVHQINPYREGSSQESIDHQFCTIQLMDAYLKARASKSH